MGRYKDRRHAGRVLAEALREYAGRPDVVVLALPRGGVPVAYEVARRLGAPLDVFVVRKLGLPGHEEFAMGALASGGVIVLDRAVIQGLGISSGAIEAAIAREQAELARRERLYRGDRPPLDVTGKTVILVDDGLATGSTMRAATWGSAPTLRLLHTDLAGNVLQTLSPGLSPSSNLIRGLGFDNGSMFIAGRNVSTSTNFVYEIDRTSGAVLRSFALPGTTTLAALTGGTVFVPVPEPASIVTIAIGLTGLWGRRRR